MQLSNISSEYFDEDSFIKELDRYNYSLLHLNIRSVPKNVNSFITYMKNLKINFDVIGLTATWINEANTNLYNIEDHVQRDLYRKERRGGGVSSYI